MKKKFNVMDYDITGKRIVKKSAAKKVAVGVLGIVKKKNSGETFENMGKKKAQSKAAPKPASQDSDIVSLGSIHSRSTRGGASSGSGGSAHTLNTVNSGLGLGKRPTKMKKGRPRRASTTTTAGHS
jgi:hypothetical protein